MSEQPIPTINREASRVRTDVLREAERNNSASARHPYAYCEKKVGLAAGFKYVDVLVGDEDCRDKGYELKGFISQALKNQVSPYADPADYIPVALLPSNRSAKGAADRIVGGGLKVSGVSEAGFGRGNTALGVIGVVIVGVGLFYKSPFFALAGLILMVISLASNDLAERPINVTKTPLAAGKN